MGAGAVCLAYGGLRVDGNGEGEPWAKPSWAGESYQAGLEEVREINLTLFQHINLQHAVFTTKPTFFFLQTVKVKECNESHLIEP